MISFLLSPLPSLSYIAYSNFIPALNQTTGKRILTDLLFTLILGSVIYTLTSADSNYPGLGAWFGFTLTIENYGAMLSCSSVIFVLYIGPLVQTAFIEDEGQEFNLPELKEYVTDALVIEGVRLFTVNLFLTSGFGFNGSVAFSSLALTWVLTRKHYQGLAIQNAAKHGKLAEMTQEIFCQFGLALMLSYMYVRTGSYLAAVLVHVFKNFMGFPDTKFFRPDHKVYAYRFIVLLAYAIGAIGGWFLFSLIMMNPELYTPWHASFAF